MVVADLLRAAIVVSIPFLIHDQHRPAVRRRRARQHDLAVLQPGERRRPARGGSDEELAAANSWIMISSFGSTSIGFALSGLLATAFDINWAFYLDG